MTPRYASTRKPNGAATSLERFREESFELSVAEKAFWNFATTPALGGSFEPEQALTHDEYRVLSLAASGGSFLVPGDVEEQIVSAARAQSAVARLALAIQTADGQPMTLPDASTLGSAAWTGESIAYTASDETYFTMDSGQLGLQPLARGYCQAVAAWVIAVPRFSGLVEQ